MTHSWNFRKRVLSHIVKRVYIKNVFMHISTIDRVGYWMPLLPCYYFFVVPLSLSLSCRDRAFDTVLYRDRNTQNLLHNQSRVASLLNVNETTNTCSVVMEIRL